MVGPSALSESGFGGGSEFSLRLAVVERSESPERNDRGFAALNPIHPNAGKDFCAGKQGRFSRAMYRTNGRR